MPGKTEGWTDRRYFIGPYIATAGGLKMKRERIKGWSKYHSTRATAISRERILIIGMFFNFLFRFF